MDLDEMKAKWAEHDRKLDTVISLNRQLLKETRLNKVQTVLQRAMWWRGVEAILAVLPVLWLGSFLYDHRTEMPFALPALILHLCAIANLSMLLRQIVTATQVGYNKPIATLQRELEGARMLSIRHIQWIFLLSPLIGILMLIVGFKGCFGLDLYQIVDKSWIVGNIVFGVAFIPVALALSKLFHASPYLSPLLRRMADGLAGTEWIKAKGFLNSLSEFVDE